MKYVIVYLWQGERYRGLDYPTLERATADLRDFRAAGWSAWVETL